jgi:hypothetical protein
MRPRNSSAGGNSFQRTRAPGIGSADRIAVLIGELLLIGSMGRRQRLTGPRRTGKSSGGEAGIRAKGFW